MWCEHCQTDVATIVADDGQSLLCTTCGQPARKIVAPSLHPETKSAREFLERWAREQQALKQQRSAEGTGSTVPKPPEPPAAPAISADAAPAPSAEIASDAKKEPGSSPPPTPIPRSKTRWRLDSEHTAPHGPLPNRQDHPRRSQRLEKMGEEIEPSPPAETSLPSPEPIAATPPVTSPTPAEAAPRKKRATRIDAAHTDAHGPHFNPQVNAPRKSSFPGRMEAMWGQLMAYLGVGLLTTGTAFVLWGYFGEIEQYASTGWLVATAGQMLLLLGIVTLVGGGMQQTTHEVSQRIEHLGGRIIRIEQSTDKILRGPHFRRSRRRASQSATREQDAA